MTQKRQIFSIILGLIVLTEFFGGGSAIYFWKRNINKSPQVLGSTIHVSENGSNPESNLTYYYEPKASTAETDSTKWLTQKIVWNYNKDGLNDRFDYTIEKPSNTKRIIALGDSFTFGDHVPTGNSWPELLEDELNRQAPCPGFNSYQVINLGVRGYDIQYEVERYRLKGMQYNPDIVIWMFISNDFDEINEKILPLRQQILSEMKQNKTYNPDQPWIPGERAKDRFLHEYSQADRYELLNTQFSYFSALFRGRLLLVTFPFLNDSDESLLKRWAIERPDTYYTDKLPKTSDFPSLNYSEHADYHPNEKGHILIAQSLYRYFTDHAGDLCR